MKVAQSVAAGAALIVIAGAVVPATVAPAAHAADAVTITVNPWYAHQEFQGWGTSLAWFANAAGRYALSDNKDANKLADDFYDLLFSENGLDLQMARYNIGGGNSSDTKDYLRPGAAVQGWWAADPDGSRNLYGGVPTTYDRRSDLLSAWNPDDDKSYDFDADASQRWWLERLQQDHQITNWEFFVNSAPYFMTNSGYVSGHWRGSWDDQLAGTGEETAPAVNASEKFAKYVARVSKYLSDQYKITADSIEPFNEPNDCPNCWATDGSAGAPQARQEGMSIKPDQQTRVIKDLRAALDAQGLKADSGKNLVSAMDASSSQSFRSDYLGSDNGNNGYAQNLDEWVDSLGQLNSHGYGDQSQVRWIRDIAKTYDKPLMQSEFEGDYSGSGFNLYDITNGLNFSNKINEQMAMYEPKSWVLWQPVEDYYNMEQPRDKGGEDTNWGSIFIDFDCKEYTRQDGSSVFASERRVERLFGGVDGSGKVANDVPACTLATNSKFNMLKNYTHFIQAGDTVVATDSGQATAAVRHSDNSLRLVYTNTDSSAKSVDLDLSGFADIAAGATVQKYVTTEAPAGGSTTANALVHDAGGDVAVNAGSRSATLEVPARSVTTFVVTGVSGVSADAPAATDGHDYQIVARDSGKPLSASGSAVSADPDSAATAQKWTLHQLPATAARPADHTFVITGADGAVLVGDGSGVRTTKSLSVADAEKDAAAIWNLNSTDGRTFSLVNRSRIAALEVGSGSGGNALSVGMSDSNGSGGQEWALRDLRVASPVNVARATAVGTAPSLPATVTPSYAWGEGTAVPVSWQMPDASVWNTAGSVSVDGTATDVFGTSFAVKAVVEVGDFTTTDPASVTVIQGTSLADVQGSAPASVDAHVGASTVPYPTAVTWDWSSFDASALQRTGVSTVTGRAAALSGSAGLPATLNVIVVSGVEQNIARLPATRVGASFTEKEQYSAENTRDGDLDTAWSNWKPESGADRQPWLSYTFDRPYALTGLDFYVGLGGDGAPEAPVGGIRVDYRDESGAWVSSDVATTQINAQKGVATHLDLSALPATTGVRLDLQYGAGQYYTKVAEVAIFGEVPTASDVSTLSALRADGVDVAGFAPGTTTYTVRAGQTLPEVFAVATDSAAKVDLTQASDANGATASIVVTAQDAAATTAYSVVFVRDAALRAAIQDAGQLSESAYTPGSWAGFADALSAANATLARADATQREVDDAVTALAQARGALVTAVAPSPSPSVSPSPSPSGSASPSAPATSAPSPAPSSVQNGHLATTGGQSAGILWVGAALAMMTVGVGAVLTARRRRS